jgi:hypothetical protein
MPIRPALLILAAAGATAAEPVLSDLRLGIEARPTAFAFTWDDHGRGRGGDDAFTQAWALGVGWRGGRGRAGAAHQLSGGGDLLAVQESASLGIRRALLARAALGWAWGLHDDWTAGAEALAAAGPARWTLDAGTTGAVPLDGWMAEGGARAWLRWRPGQRWSLAGEAGWLLGRDRLAGDQVAMTTTRSGPLFALTVGWTLDPRPRPLDP